MRRARPYRNIPPLFGETGLSSALSPRAIFRAPSPGPTCFAMSGNNSDASLRLTVEHVRCKPRKHSAFALYAAIGVLKPNDIVLSQITPRLHFDQE